MRLYHTTTHHTPDRIEITQTAETTGDPILDESVETGCDLWYIEVLAELADEGKITFEEFGRLIC